MFETESLAIVLSFRCKKSLRVVSEFELFEGLEVVFGDEYGRDFSMPGDLDAFVGILGAAESFAEVGAKLSGRDLRGCGHVPKIAKCPLCTQY
ncbi:MAG: hypothetical protein E7A06_12400 [Clostridiales bacterium]|nr:hypothetical protein [Clostridiales bacterium]